MPAQGTNRQIRSLVKASGEVELSLVEVPMPEPDDDEVVIEMRAAPINPSDLGLLLGGGDPDTASITGTIDQPVTTLRVPPAAMAGMRSRLDQSMAVGNEGAGLVIDAGAAADARSLLGRTVAIMGGPTYCRYRKVKAAACLELPDGATAADGASCFVNPLTALGMLDTMRSEGHAALVHTAAASNLGQMLNRICLKDGVGLVNIVRSPQQVDMLREIGAAHVCDASAASFADDLPGALKATGATLAFDAVGGGTLASRILAAMESAAGPSAQGYSRYGSTTHKQVSIYGGLDQGPTVLDRSFGMAWGVGGWLVTAFLGRAGPARVAELKARVGSELTTTFASRYTRTLSLSEALAPGNIRACARRATGEKYLLDPSL